MSALGFIGVGVMGEPMARRLLRAGHPLRIYDPVPEPVSRLAADGAVACRDAAEVAEGAEVIFLMVRDAAQVEQVLSGPGGLAGRLTARHTLVCLSTLNPEFMKGLAGRLPGVALLDAPVSGGRAGAESGELAFMVGGDAAVCERVEPFLAVMGHQIRRIGPLGSGQVAKAANQIVITLTRAAIGEAFLFAARSGVDPEQVRQALLGGLARSATLETYGPRVSGLENPVQFESEILKKDINNTVAAAEAIGVHLPFATLVRDCYNHEGPRVEG